jgi:hypothetical protein
MKKFVFIGILLSIGSFTFGQTVDELKETIFGNLNASKIENCILINASVLPFDISQFNGIDTTIIGTSESYYQSLAKLNSAKLCNAPTTTIHSLQKESNILQNTHNIVPLGLIATSYSSINENAFENGSLAYINGVIIDQSSNYSPYDINHCVLLTPLTTNVVHDNGEAVFFLGNDFILDNLNINRIEIDFDDGNGFIEVSINNEVYVIYNSIGLKTIKSKLTVGTETYSTISNIHIINNISNSGGDHGSSRTPDETENIETLYNGETIKGQYGIYYGCNNSEIVKPVIVIEGFDPFNSKTLNPDKDKHNLYAITDTEENLMDNLRNAGFDIIILDFDENTIDLRANAQLSASLIQEINQLKQTDNELVVMGRSGGGLIARYALAYLEQQNINHETRLLLTIDAPHEGANIPLGLQHFLQVCTTQAEIAILISTLGIWSIDDLLSSTLNSKYSKQILYYHHKSTNTRGKQAKPSQDYIDFFNSLNNQNGGYPTKLKKVAISNGSRTAQSQGFAPAQQLLAWDFPSDYFGTTLRISSNVKALPDIGQSCKIMEANVEARFPIIPLIVYSPWFKVFGKTVEVNNTPPYDNAPGGNTSWHSLTLEHYIPGWSWTATLLFPGIQLTSGSDCFVPIRSALALNNAILPSDHGGLFYNIDAELALNSDIFKYNNFYYNFSEDISPFDVLYVDNANKIHGTSNSDWSSLFENEIYPATTYLQNQEIENKRTVYAREHIKAGRNVTQNLPSGDVIVNQGSKLTLTVGESIILKSGFTAEEGSEFIAQIREEQDCNTLLQTVAGNGDSGLEDNTYIENKSTENQIFSIITETEKEFTIFPNPTTDKLYISCNKYLDAFYNVDIIDQNGSILISVKNQGRNTILDLSSLTSGIYFVRILLENKLFTEKIIKQ